MKRLALLTLLMPALACQQDPPIGRITRAAGSADGTADAMSDAAATVTDADAVSDAGGPGCGQVPYEGCCSRQVLWWCESGVLKHKDCSFAPKCGWSTSGFYDCNTSGAPDPDGDHAFQCGGLLPDGGPAVDATADAGEGECGAITLEGCCDGTTLKYCAEGKLRTVSCALNPQCGWFAMGQYYDCGTAGLEDPTGTTPRLCPGATPTDGTPDLFPAEDSATDLGVDGGDGGGGDGDCDCVVGATPPPAGLPAALLLVLVLLPGMRRRG